MDSYRIVTTNPGFVSNRGSWIQPFSKDSFRGFVSWRNFQKIRFADSFRDAIFKRFDESDESYESSRILSTIDLRIHTNPVLPDSRIQSIFKRFVLWIRFVLRCSKDSFRGFVFERFVSWIRFVDSFLKDLFRGFVSWNFFFQITRFVLFRKDSYTNPATLVVLFSNLQTVALNSCDNKWLINKNGGFVNTTNMQNLCLLA